MADEKPNVRAEPAPHAEQTMVTVTLKVPMSEADLGAPAAKAGDTVAVPADVAERWIAAGIAEAGGAASTEPTEAPPDKPAGGATGRRGGAA